ncbi:hypothetical protein [Roseomonas populi]|uniref:Uncharacterized protein n=1 Tax=Roseomonas populi TaxID=3121582 RepID=A0ABT1X140_9PROT|nr:hypothetical protein [Roseomonas pecuniae]MCR0981820.1 hypothetical protein [Roseomonas pecuniae]
MRLAEALAWMGALALIIAAPLIFGATFIQLQEGARALLRGAL